MWRRHARHRHRRRDADEDQQRRHQEAAADAEHAGDEADRQPHPQNEEDVDGQVGDRKIDLHEARRPPLRGQCPLNRSAPRAGSPCGQRRGVRLRGDIWPMKSWRSVAMKTRAITLLRQSSRACSPFSYGEGAERQRGGRLAACHAAGPAWVAARLLRGAGGVIPAALRLRHGGGRLRLRLGREASRPPAGRRPALRRRGGRRPRRAFWRFPGRLGRRPARTICRIRQSPFRCRGRARHRTPRLYWLSAMPCCAALRNHFTAVP